MSRRVYLDWNATAPLRPEARAAMIAAMDVVGNPSSVHAEGRAAKALMERARAQIAAALGAEGQDIIFTSGATEAASLALAGRGYACAAIEHDAVSAWCAEDLAADGFGRVSAPDPARAALQLANSETGVIQQLPEGLAVSDLTQAFGKIPFAFNWLGVTAGLVSAHKLGGPKGIGALVVRRGTDIAAQLRGGGQEMGRRAGTENLIGIAGFGAAAEAAARDLAAGVWEEVAEIRNILKNALEESGETLYFPGWETSGDHSADGGQGPAILPNTLSIVSPGWKGETQVMRLDLMGFGVSAGSACSSGKVRASKVLRAMGWSEDMAASALRVSLGPGVTKDEVLRFAEAFGAALKKHRARV
ncbi:aminotransferase class V-fold PLP-dependent enzyme [Sedimentimonas flavescens]|uniref:Cysteine desulfurase n=1 Tax=Sedimentimonas flavescens TaxID=2851012 RepID=A0ABT2ZX43_9RHOB|nr:aminotransferase class V-fold PLP-dependent enzyme [Sedimentimonas flavescens]MCV2878307.1 aminotransferase class V-fold PLP-dependent enzyme [Sedimentimonas flavescens]